MNKETSMNRYSNIYIITYNTDANRIGAMANNRLHVIAYCRRFFPPE